MDNQDLMDNNYKQGLKAFDARPEGASRPGLKGLKTLM